MANPTTLQSQPYTITPKDAQGNPVDTVKFPTALTAITYAVDNAAFTATPAADNLSASVKANDPAVGGDVVLTVTATAVDGSALSEAAPSVTFDVPVPVVTSLNVAVGTPV